MVILAPAKVNLILEITGRDEQGYHLLDGVMCPVTLYDKVEVNFRSDNKINVTFAGDDIDPQNNTAYRAAQIFCARFGGADILINKGIPQKAGLGGSSVDAAAVIKAYAQNFLIDSETALDAALSLGADVPFCYRGQAARAQGRGEVLTPVKLKAPLNLVIAMTGQVNTADCYARYKKDNPVISAPNSKTPLMINALENGDLCATGSLMSSALESASKAINPGILSAAAALKSTNPLGITMTGSGGAYIALYPDRLKALEALQLIKDKVNFAAAVKTI